MTLIEVFNRVLGLPIIELALAVTSSTYNRVKDSNQLVHWVLSTAETSLTDAMKQDVPIHISDDTQCHGLNKIDEKVPIVEGTPNEIQGNAYMLALEMMRTAVSTITVANDLIVAQTTYLKDVSWNKDNKIFAPDEVTAAIQELTDTAVSINKLLDKYFPVKVTDAIGAQPDAKFPSGSGDQVLAVVKTAEVVESVKEISNLHENMQKNKDSQTTATPQIEIFNRVLRLPIIELTLAVTSSTYNRVKDSNQLVHWVLSTSETSLTNVTRQAVPIAAPFAKKFQTAIHFFDDTLCRGLDKIEEKVPIVKGTPNEILENAYMLTLETVRPAVSTITYANDLIVAQATNLKDVSWKKANKILGTNYGTAAIHGLNNTPIDVDNL